MVGSCEHAQECPLQLHVNSEVGQGEKGRASATSSTPSAPAEFVSPLEDGGRGHAVCPHTMLYVHYLVLGTQEDDMS